MKDKPDPEFTIVIPAYNEADRIRVLLDDIESFHKDTGLVKKVIVVDDGSKDDTVDRVFFKATSVPVEVIMKSNGGKWSALRSGVAAADGLIVMMDADGSVSPYELLRCRGLNKGFAFVGTRFGPDAVVVGKSWKRSIVSSAYRWYVRMWYAIAKGRETISDMQCPFKVFWKEDLEGLWAEDGFCGDVEMALLLRASIINLPVRFVHRKGGSVRATTALKMLICTPRAALRGMRMSQR